MSYNNNISFYDACTTMELSHDDGNDREKITKQFAKLAKDPRYLADGRVNETDGTTAKGDIQKLLTAKKYLLDRKNLQDTKTAIIVFLEKYLKIESCLPGRLVDVVQKEGVLHWQLNKDATYNEADGFSETREKAAQQIVHELTGIELSQEFIITNFPIKLKPNTNFDVCFKVLPLYIDVLEKHPELNPESDGLKIAQMMAFDENCIKYGINALQIETFITSCPLSFPNVTLTEQNRNDMLNLRFCNEKLVELGAPKKVSAETNNAKTAEQCSNAMLQKDIKISRTMLQQAITATKPEQQTEYAQKFVNTMRQLQSNKGLSPSTQKRVAIIGTVAGAIFGLGIGGVLVGLLCHRAGFFTSKPSQESAKAIMPQLEPIMPFLGKQQPKATSDADAQEEKIPSPALTA